jgi:hypothetical protein
MRNNIEFRRNDTFKMCRSYGILLNFLSMLPEINFEARKCTEPLALTTTLF